MNQKRKAEPGFLKSIILFLKSKQFRIHFIISVGTVAMIIWGALKALDIYTHHKKYIIVPDFSHMSVENISRFATNNHLRYEIIDSVYDPKIKGGIVLKQDPEKNTYVKENRIIYLTVSAKSAPLIKMPNLVDASMRQALTLLETYGLKAGNREYLPDPCVNCVLAQLYKGKKIEPGKMIPKGSVIDLVLGKGQEGELMKVPCVIGLTQKDASEKLAETGMSEGTIICTDCKTNADKEKATVYKQNPGCSPDNLVSPGTPIDLFLSVNPVKSKEENNLHEDEETE